MPSSAPAFVLRDVEQVRGDVHTLRGVDLEIPSGEVIALVGPSGAGKTSLLRLLNRLDDPASGTIAYRGDALSSMPVRELRRRVAFVFQSPVMFAGSVARNLAIARELATPTAPTSTSGRPQSSVRTASASPAVTRPSRPPLSDDEALRLAGVEPALALRDAQSLSGGERQRVSIARALISNPETLLLDEPTSALDPEVADHFMTTIRALADTMRLTVVMVTHRLAEARDASTHTVFIEAGRVIETGPTPLMFTAPDTPRSREYLLRESRP